jgi:apolipoprotein D and lipocalin family protein
MYFFATDCSGPKARQFTNSAHREGAKRCTRLAMRGSIRRWGVLVVLGAALIACGSDPPLSAASSVDLGQFQGKWYEIARLPRSTQTDCHGTTAFYTQQGDGTLSFVNQCNVGATDGPLKTVSMVASVPDTHSPAKLLLDVGGFSGDYWILEVGANYEYAVVGHPSRQYLWILSRTATLDADTLQGIIGRAQGQQFDMSKIQYTPQPPAGERSTLAGPEGPVPPAVKNGCSAGRGPGEPVGGAAGGIALAAAALWSARRRSRQPRISHASPNSWPR